MKLLHFTLLGLFISIITLISCEILEVPVQDDNKEVFGPTQIQIRLTDEPINAQEVNIDLK